MKAQLRVSEAAQLVGVSPSTLRAWESSGLVSPSRRGRYRRFSPSDVKVLQQIAALRAQGFSAAAIRTMLPKRGGAAAESGSLGGKLRAARRRRGLSLREASGLAGLSVSHLSAIERGTRNISLAGLQRLAVALGISVSDLFGSSPGSGRRLVHAGQRPVLDTGDRRVRVESLAVGAQLLEPHLYLVQPDGGSEGSYHHDGEEMVYVLRGEVEFWLNEIERHVVRAGDCLTFPSSLRHRWRNSGDERLEMLWVNTPITF
ncbi:MAG TPA: MerR family transcriptional regulator [Streptosporangiaceae bacterium]|nr:MerR family transcriptional regulator [Streptosporangiaceae bacterium]